MNTSIPATADIKARLAQLSHAQVQHLSSESGVPFTTIWKVRSGETQNPGIETVRQFARQLELVAGKGPETVPA